MRCLTSRSSSKTQSTFWKIFILGLYETVMWRTWPLCKVYDLIWNSIGIYVLNVCIKSAELWLFVRRQKCELEVQSYCMDFHRSLSDVSLSLVMDQDFSSISPIIKCQSKIIKLNKAFSALAVSPSQIEPPPKKMKLDLHSKNYLKKEFSKRSSRIQLDGAKTVTAVTSLSPLLAFHRVCCIVLLHARKKNHQKDGLQQSKKITVLCGKILLSLEDISNGRYSIKMLRDNSYCTGKWIYILWIHKYIYLILLFTLGGAQLSFSLNTSCADFLGIKAGWNRRWNIFQIGKNV